MGYKSKVFAGEKVELSAGYWAQVRPLNGDEARAFAELATADPTGGQSARTKESLALLLTTAVTVWNLDDDDGKILPITAETLAELSVLDQMTLVKKANTLNNPLADEQAKGK